MSENLGKIGEVRRVARFVYDSIIYSTIFLMFLVAAMTINYHILSIVALGFSAVFGLLSFINIFRLGRYVKNGQLV